MNSIIIFLISPAPENRCKIVATIFYDFETLFCALIFLVMAIAKAMESHVYISALPYVSMRRLGLVCGFHSTKVVISTCPCSGDTSSNLSGAP